jgi:CHC2 zinc finger
MRTSYKLSRKSSPRNKATVRVSASPVEVPPPLDAHELKSCADLVEFVSQFTRLRRSGRQLVGLCPLHTERHPSFYVHPGKQVFYCFGCGAGGDVFAFIMRVHDCDFRRALEIVAACSDGIARASEPRSGSRFGASERAKPLSPPTADTRYSQSCQDSRARILAALDATDRRLRAIQSQNRATSAALATACEPCGEAVSFT